MSDVATMAPGPGVGLRALRANLSEYVAVVKAGHAVTVTDHGRAVARLVPAGRESAYDRLVAEGVIQPARRRAATLEAPLAADGTVSDLVSEQKR